MIEDQTREDIAFIRRAIEEGGAYATASSPDMLVWGIAVAIGYLGTYGFVRGWSPVSPGALWAACLGLPWLFSLRRVAAMVTGEARNGWCNAIVAGVMGIAFFASASLARLPWLRWVGIAWWIGELVLFALRHRVEVLPLSAALMLLLLAGPGYVLMSGRVRRVEA